MNADLVWGRNRTSFYQFAMQYKKPHVLGMVLHLLCIVPPRFLVVMQGLLSLLYAGSYKRLNG